MRGATALREAPVGGFAGWLCFLKIKKHERKRCLLGAEYCPMCGRALDESSAVYVGTTRPIFSREGLSIERSQQ